MPNTILVCEGLTHYMITLVSVPDLNKPIFKLIEHNKLRIGDRVLDTTTDVSILIEDQSMLEIAIAGGYVLLIPFIPLFKS